MMEIDKNGFLKLSKKSNKKIKTRQDAPKVFQLTGLFVFNTEKFLEKWNKKQQLKILPYEISPETGLMIDTKFEFFIAETMFRNKF